MAHKGEIPPFRSDLLKKFGHLSFQCGLINLDIIGVRLLSSNETIAILYRGAYKCGWIYEGQKFTNQQVLQLYDDVPNSYNNLEEFEKRQKEFIEILIPQKDNYVFINEKLVNRK